MRKIYNGLLITLFLLTSELVYAHCYGPTMANEHLYRIALQVRPDSSLSVQQTMLALLQANPAAFNQNNINGLKSGYRLHVPSITQIKRISPDKALAKVAWQNKSWYGGNQATEPRAPLRKSSEKPKQLAAAKVGTKTHSNHSAKQENLQPRAIVAEKPTTTEGNTSSAASPESKSSVLDLSQKQPPQETAPVTVVKEIAVQSEQQKQFEQQTTSQIAALQQKSEHMQNSINLLTQDIRTLTYRFIQMNAENSKKTVTYNDVFIKNLKTYGPIIGASLLGLIILGYLLKRTFGRKPTGSEIKRDEYDYMGSEESIPAKLDLARAYMDMGDDVAAKNALNEVIIKGSAEQRQEARDLLSKLPSSKA